MYGVLLYVCTADTKSNKKKKKKKDYVIIISHILLDTTRSWFYQIPFHYDCSWFHVCDI